MDEQTHKFTNTVTSISRQFNTLIKWQCKLNPRKLVLLTFDIALSNYKAHECTVKVRINFCLFLPIISFSK